MNAQFVDWSVNSRVAGEVKSGGGMTFVAVEAAGHMVPMDQPEVVRSQPVQTVAVNDVFQEWTVLTVLPTLSGSFYSGPLGTQQTI